MANTNTTLTTGKVRLSYVHLAKPYAHQVGQEEKYSATILVPKSDIATKQAIDAAINAAIQQGVAEKWGGQRPTILPIPVYDGDGTRPSDGAPFGPECKGHYVFTASSKDQRAVVDLNMQPIIVPTEIYSGMYARVSVSFYPYNSNGRKGIGCGLNAVQKIEDGEPLAGGVSVEQAFGGTNAFQSAPSYGGAQQMPGYQPPWEKVTASVPPMTAPASGQAQYQPMPNYGGVQQAQTYQPIPDYTVVPPTADPAYYQQPAVDPITGAPIIPGGVTGI